MMKLNVSIDKFTMDYKDVPHGAFLRLYMMIMVKMGHKVKMKYGYEGALYVNELHIKKDEKVYMHIYYRNFNEITGHMYTLRIETRPEHYAHLVMKPDMTEVTFKYDSLGRRIEKCSEGKATHFVWDGNTILHEYFSQDNSVENASQTEADIAENLVTWVFNDGFVPSAKITNEGNYSIISDYLGTPVK
ncbi:hypothetical protein ACQKNX_09295 [Lysinibacillus sp. NPDC093712]|uniref:hypothetical protein n=1 Tax=Lysinibacillus sp. NPDC093712 TaxID=3390579 RepID=UPI003D085B03